MARTINPFGASTRDALAEAERMAASPRRSKKATLEKYRQREHPLEAALEEELGFTFYDTVLTRAEIAVWEQEFGREFLCPLRQIARTIFREKRVFVQSACGTGKTVQAAQIAAIYAKLFPAEQTSGDYGAVWVGTAPPKDNLDKIFGYVASLATSPEHRWLFDGDVHRSNYLKSARNPNSGLQGQPFPQSGEDAKKIAAWKGKHAPHQIIIDEADGIEPVFWTAIEMCLTGEDEHLLCLFNPNTPLGQVYDWVRTGWGHVVHISAFDHPNVITGENRIPGAVSREKVVYEILDKSRPHVDEEAEEGAMDLRLFEVPRYLVGCHAEIRGRRRVLGAGLRLVTDGRLDTEILGRYPAQSRQRLFQDAHIDAARLRYDLYVAEHGERRPVGVAPVLGVDPSEGGEGDRNALVVRYGDFVLPPMTRPGADVNQLGAWAATVAREHSCRMAFVDAISYGQGTAYIMIDGYTYHPEDAQEPIVIRGLGRSRVVLVKVSRRPEAIHETKDGSFKLLKDFLAWRVMLWLKHEPLLGVYSTAMLPPDENLLRTLRIIEWHNDRAGLINTSDKATLRPLLGGSPNEFDALAATFADGLSAPKAFKPFMARF
jgi:hypothetical protein